MKLSIDNLLQQTLPQALNLQRNVRIRKEITQTTSFDLTDDERETKIVLEKGIKVIVSDRWLKKNVIKALKNAGGEFVIINTLDIPVDKDGKMDPEALLKVYKENTDNLLDALSKF